jgi:hypothetical protein
LEKYPIAIVSELKDSELCPIAVLKEFEASA